MKLKFIIPASARGGSAFGRKAGIQPNNIHRTFALVSSIPLLMQEGLGVVRVRAEIIYHTFYPSLIPLLTSPMLGEESNVKIPIQKKNPDSRWSLPLIAIGGGKNGGRLFNWFLIFLLSVPFILSAQAPDPAPVNTVLTNFLALLTVVIKILISLAFVVFGWGVITFILASSDEKKIREAKNIILYGIIAIFVLASMGGIVTFIKKYIGIPDNSPIQPPTFTMFLTSHADFV